MAFVNIVEMEFTKRSLQQFSFKRPDLVRLKELESKITDKEGFRNRYGSLALILKTDIDKGILETLVQFYDPLYHCFTFPDYQLVPTLEEYAFWMDLPILDKEPFNGREPAPKAAVIAAALHLKPSDVINNLTVRNDLQGLTAKFLFRKAFDYAAVMSFGVVEAILALLIYGLVLFPNVDNFVDMDAIKIFLSKNPVPTLLADTYHAIHHRTDRGGGLLRCCAPLLCRWFISHLPRTPVFKANLERLLWSHRIMLLTPADIVWHNATHDGSGVIITDCGEFPNVPLIGRFGGITYNPILAKRQFGYPVTFKPSNIHLAGVYYLNDEDSTNMRDRFVKAWRSVQKKGKDVLGRRSGFVSEEYTQWIVGRAKAFGMPYSMLRDVSVTPLLTPPPVPVMTRMEYQQRMIEMTLELNACKGKLHVAERQNEALKDELVRKDRALSDKDEEIAELKSLLRAKDAILSRASNKRSRLDFFEGPSSDSEDMPGLQ